MQAEAAPLSNTHAYVSRGGVPVRQCLYPAVGENHHKHAGYSSMIRFDLHEQKQLSF